MMDNNVPLQIIYPNAESYVVMPADAYGSTGYVYLVWCNGVYKIGCTNDLVGRMKRMRTKYPPQIKYVLTIYSERYQSLEGRLHMTFDKAQRRLLGEWYALEPEDIEWLKSFPGAVEL